MTAEHTLPGTEATVRPSAPSRARLVVAAALLVLVAVVVGLIVGRVTAASAPPTPSDTSAEAGFARDMQVHHGQAVEMALLVRDRTEDPEIRLLALDVATGQTQQQGQMYAWLAMWGLPQTSSEPEMTWMTRPPLDGSASHGEHSGTEHVPGEPMPGLATFEQMQALQQAEGVEAERLFLELMIAHHIGGVEMAEAVVARSDEPVVLDLAAGMIALQQKEIDYMTELLDARQ